MQTKLPSVAHCARVTSVAVILVVLAGGCGGTGYEDHLVASDSADSAGTAPGAGQQGDSQVPAPITTPVPYVAGEAFRLEPGADSLTALLPCKSEDNSGEQQFDERQIRFEPSSGEFFVNGGRVFDGGFAWDPVSGEFVASRVVPIGTASGEYRAKVRPDGMPSYYRYKLTLKDFSFRQVECYAGMAG